MLAANPDSVPGLLASSRFALGTGNDERALSLVRRAVELAPADAATHVDHGLVLAQTNQLPQAVAAYQQALSIDPNLPDAQSNLATLLFQTGRIDEGTRLLEQAAMAFPGRWAAAPWPSMMASPSPAARQMIGRPGAPLLRTVNVPG